MAEDVGLQLRINSSDIDKREILFLRLNIGARRKQRPNSGHNRQNASKVREKHLIFLDAVH